MSNFEWTFASGGPVEPAVNWLSSDLSRSRSDHRFCFCSFCATRAFTTFLISAVGNGLSNGKWMVPFDVEKPLSSFSNALITEAVGNKLQWSANAANHTRTPLCLNAGIP